jgi:hypothetical protein
LRLLSTLLDLWLLCTSLKLRLRLWRLILWLYLWLLIRWLWLRLLILWLYSVNLGLWSLDLGLLLLDSWLWSGRILLLLFLLPPFLLPLFLLGGPNEHRDHQQKQKCKSLPQSITASFARIHCSLLTIRYVSPGRQSDAR